MTDIQLSTKQLSNSKQVKINPNTNHNPPEQKLSNRDSASSLSQSTSDIITAYKDFIKAEQKSKQSIINEKNSGVFPNFDLQKDL